MKKILASALLAGLLLGATTPVFAAGTSPVTKDTVEPSTTTNSTIEGDYTITIPTSLTIDLMNSDTDDSQGTVKLTELTAAGSITATAVSTDMILNTIEPSTAALADQKIETSLTDGTDAALGESFTLSKTEVPADSEQVIKIVTTETSTMNVAGTYIGAVDFTFAYTDPNTIQ